MPRDRGQPGPGQSGAAEKDVVETGGRITLAGRDGNAGAEWNSLPSPAKTAGQQVRDCPLAGETRIVRRGIEIAADDPGERAKFAIGPLHRLHVRKQLVHRLFADPDVFSDVAAVALEVEGVNEQDLAGRQLVSGEGETARRRNGHARLPLLGPGAQRRETAGDGNLLGLPLVFARREIGTDIHFKSVERFHGKRGVPEIADFFQGNEVGIDLSEVGMNSAKVPLFFGA